ncbi:MAG: hypothetical protein AAF564_15360 [Bacteroidota bacterium]
MKHPYYLSVCTLLCLLSFSSAQAQTNNILLDSYTLKTNQRASLAQLPDIKTPATQNEVPARLLFPNIKQSVKNNLTNQPDMVFVWKTQNSDNKPHFNYALTLETNSTPLNVLDPNAGSVDPHIFYAPNEAATPAGIVIKPLKNLDPDMVINPDEQPF